MDARRMTAAEVAETADAAIHIATAVREALTTRPLHVDQMRSALAIATTMIVAYANMQAYLDELATCADAKEHARAVEAGEVPDVH